MIDETAMSSALPVEVTATQKNISTKALRQKEWDTEKLNQNHPRPSVVEEFHRCVRGHEAGVGVVDWHLNSERQICKSQARGHSKRNGKPAHPTNDESSNGSLRAGCNSTHSTEFFSRNHDWKQWGKITSWLLLLYQQNKRSFGTPISTSFGWIVGIPNVKRGVRYLCQ